MCFHCRKFGVQVAFYELARLFHGALHQHAFKAPVDLLVEFGARRGEGEADPFILLQDRGLAILLEVGQRLAGGEIDFIGAGEALAVARAEAVGGLGVDRGEPGAQALGAFGIGNGADICADLFRDGRNAGQALNHGEQVEAGATHQDGALAPQFEVANGRADVLQPLAGGIAFGGVDMAEEMVLYAAHFLFGGPGRNHLQVAVDLHGVGIDHFPSQTARHLNGQGSLAAGGGSVNENCRYHPYRGRGLSAARKPVKRRE